MTDNISRQPQGIPVGGQFAPTSHAEPALVLGGPAPASFVPFRGSVELHESGFGALPELPASIGTPEVTFDFNNDGQLETQVTVDGSPMSFWYDRTSDEITNSADTGYAEFDGETPWSNIAGHDDRKQARAWAESVHERIDGATYRVLNTAMEDTAARNTIVAFATGRAEPAVKLTPEQESARRAAAAMAIAEEGQGSDVTMRDLLTDLRHYADARGIDIHKALDDSFEYYQHEKTNPSFKEIH